MQYLPGDADGDGLQSGISDLTALRDGVAEGLIFYDADFGYAGLASASWSYSRLYVTHDGGLNFETVILPLDTVTEIPEPGPSLGFTSSDYDYYNVPEQVGDDLYILAITDLGEKADSCLSQKTVGITGRFVRKSKEKCQRGR